MSSVCENSCPWTDKLVDAVNKLTHYILNLFSSTFEVTWDSSLILNFGNEYLEKLSEFCQELIALLSFDDFQLQLFKVFLLTFISTVALIFVAWHIYGARISEQFMTPGSVPSDCQSSSEE